MKLTKIIVSNARILAWEGKKISDIAVLLDCNKSVLYPAIKGETWADLKEPKPFKKEELQVFTCSNCNNVKNLSEICHGKQCKSCRNTYRQTLPKNKESEKRRNKKQRDKNPEIWKNYQQNYHESNKEKIKKWHVEYYQKNKQLIRSKHYIYNQQPHRIIINRMRKALRRCLNQSTIGKLRYLPYSKKDFVQYLLSTKPSNLTLEECHIDHIRPLSSFNKNELANPFSQDFLECWALNNLRLISVQENLKKSSKYVPDFTKVL